MSHPNRAYARIETARKGHARILPPGQTKPLFSGCAACAVGLPARLDPGLPEAIVHTLRAMDEKLTAILNLLNERSLADDFPIPVLVHDISGAGLRMSSPHAFAIGMQVEIVVVLNAFPLQLAGTLGTIVRRDQLDDTALWAVEFTDIRESEREKIIQFVFQEQRQSLRAQRQTTTEGA
ncbi:MAG: hypothetical protein JG760_411 [Desulfomicrobiaceae bacterium]|jgi:hypothetical protein|nr:hypothetical protein [Desulfomicrobiaceae bacterium]